MLEAQSRVSPVMMFFKVSALFLVIVVLSKWKFMVQKKGSFFIINNDIQSQKDFILRGLPGREGETRSHMIPALDDTFNHGTLANKRCRI